MLYTPCRGFSSTSRAAGSLRRSAVASLRHPFATNANGYPAAQKKIGPREGADHQRRVVDLRYRSERVGCAYIEESANRASLMHGRVVRVIARATVGGQVKGRCRVGHVQNRAVHGQALGERKARVQIDVREMLDFAVTAVDERGRHDARVARHRSTQTTERDRLLAREVTGGRVRQVEPSYEVQ